MKQNAEVESLTEEQHEVLEWLARIRHEVHVSSDDVWTMNESNDVRDALYSDEIEDRLDEVGLPSISLPEMSSAPSIEDYYEILDDDERGYWEERAEKINNENRKSGVRSYFTSDGVSLWKEESGAYVELCDKLEQWNEAVEKYLRDIDKRHHTRYAPSGMSRI